MRERKTTVDFRLRRIFRREEIVEILLRTDHLRVRVAEVFRARMEGILNRGQNFRSTRSEFVYFHRLFRLHWLIAPADCGRIFFKIARTDLETQRYSLLNPLPILNTPAQIAPIDFYFKRCIGKALSAQFKRERITCFQNFDACIFLRGNRQNHNLCWRDSRRQNQTVVIAVHHDDGSHHSRGHTPARSPAKFLFPFAVLELNTARFGKVLSQEMRSAGLNGFPVLHHRFERQGLDRAGELFAFGFRSGEDRKGEIFAGETFIDSENQSRLRAGLLFGFVNGVALLPQKFGRAQKQTRPHFPSHNVGPLI